MQGQQNRLQNGRGKTNSGGGPDQPMNELDVYQEAIESTVDDDLLEDVLLGLGNYSNSEYWQQVESFRNGLYASTAFTRRLFKRAVQETKTELAIEGYEYHVRGDDGTVQKHAFEGWKDLPEGKQADLDRRRWIDDRKEEIWEEMAEEAQANAIVEIAGFESDWTPPHWRMMMMRHEASRSRGARLLDNLFGRVDEIRSDNGGGSGSVIEQLRGGSS